MRKFILDILFPIECLGCGKEGVWLCEECFKGLPLTKGYLAPIDFSPSFIDGFCIASDWENPLLQNMIHKFKYNFIQELAGPLSKLLIKKLTVVLEVYPELKDFILMPVPLHRRRRAWRGFNQAELLALQLAKKFDLKLDSDLLKRVKNTSPQTKLRSKDRTKNIKGAFGLKRKGSLNAGIFTNVLLLDDVITTGATMNECARILKSNGIKKVYGLALARG